MDQDAKLEVFKAQTANVRAIRSALKQVHRQLNSALRLGDHAAVETFTKLYALLFCAWSEANFSKLVHTPHGFSLDEIEQVKRAQRRTGVSGAWKQAVLIGVRHLDAKRGNFTPNAIQKFNQTIDDHVFDPSRLRNKLAHGQWSVALNRENSALQEDLTNKITELNMIQIMAWIETNKCLSALLESLIESPKKAFMRDWHTDVVNLEARITEAENRDIEEHIRRLKDKDHRTGAKQKRTQI